MKVGDKFWSFDSNRRRYESGGAGFPIYREHYFPVEIIGETSRSWIVGRKGGSLEIFKVPKSAPFRDKFGEFGSRPVILTDQAVNAECWSKENRHKIVRQIERTNTATLRRVAEVIGYKDSP